MLTQRILFPAKAIASEVGRGSTQEEMSHCLGTFVETVSCGLAKLGTGNLNAWACLSVKPGPSGERTGWRGDAQASV